MGSRVMETRNSGGTTVRRHLVPKRVRRSRKRAVRAAARPRKIVKPRKAAKKSTVLVKVAELATPAKSTGFTGLAKSTGIAKAAKPVKTARQMPPKRGMRRAPKAPTPEPAAPPEQPQPQPLNYLQDGALEWGIKRN